MLLSNLLFITSINRQIIILEHEKRITIHIFTKIYILKKKGVCFQKTVSTIELKLSRKRPTLNLYWPLIQRSKVLNYFKKNYNSFAQSINTVFEVGVWQNTGIDCLRVIFLGTALSQNFILIFFFQTTFIDCKNSRIITMSHKHEMTLFYHSVLRLFKHPICYKRCAAMHVCLRRILPGNLMLT